MPTAASRDFMERALLLRPGSFTTPTFNPLLSADGEKSGWRHHGCTTDPKSLARLPFLSRRSECLIGS